MAFDLLPPAPHKNLEGKRCPRGWFFGVRRVFGRCFEVLETCLGDLGGTWWTHGLLGVDFNGFRYHSGLHFESNFASEMYYFSFGNLQISHGKPCQCTLSSKDPSKTDPNPLKSIDFTEITSSLRGRSSMMSERFLMSRHALERARGDLAICPDVIPRESTTRASKFARENELFHSGAIPRSAPSRMLPASTGTNFENQSMFGVRYDIASGSQ